MEKLQIIKKLDHEGVPLFIRRLDTRFEFLVFYNKELYSKYIDVKPSIAMKFRKEQYTAKQLDDIVKLLFSMACSTIDALVKKKK